MKKESFAGILCAAGYLLESFARLANVLQHRAVPGYRLFDQAQLDLVKRWMQGSFHGESLYHVQLRLISNVHPYAESNELSPHMVTCRMALRDSNLRTDPSFRHSRKTLRSARRDQGIQSTPPPVRKVNSIFTPALRSQGGQMYDGSCHRPAESRRGEEPAGSFRPLVQSLDSEEQQNPATWSIYTFVRPPRLPDGERVPRVTAFFTACPSIVLFDPSSAYIT